MTQSGPILHVALSGAEDFLIQNGRGNAFDGRVEPDGVTFSLGSLGAYAYYYFYYSLGVPDVAEKVCRNRVPGATRQGLHQVVVDGPDRSIQRHGDCVCPAKPRSVGSMRVSCQS